MVRLVLFDIDGTLIRSGGAGVRAFERTFAEEFGLPEATKTLKFAGRTDVSLVRECFGLHGIEANERNFRRFFDHYPRNLETLLRETKGAVLPGIHTFLDDLFAAPNRPVIGLLTGNIRRGAELKLRHYGLWERFETGAFSDDHEDRNCIAARAKERGGELLGRVLKGNEVVVIGDTPHDVTCGKSIGAHVLAVSTGGHSREELRPSNPDWLVNHLGEISATEVLGI